MLNEHQLNTKVNIPSFLEFQEDGILEFFVFKFHDYFDGLIGLNILTKLGAKIDLERKRLITKNSCIPLSFKPNITSSKILIAPETKAIIKIPVDLKNGDFFIPTITISPEVTISPGVCRAENWYSLVEVINRSNTDRIILIESPIKVEPITDSYYREVNSINFKHFSGYQGLKILDNLRIDHLNFEEQKVITKLCKEFEDVFLQEDQSLTFTNKIKHNINTKDDIPIYTKSYRYPHIHKEEVRRQISDI